MTTEEKLREIIIDRYGTVSNFSKEIGVPNSTVATILKSGVQSANVKSIIKICEKLGISTDELARDRIVPISQSGNEQKDIRKRLKQYAMNLKPNCGYTIDSIEMDQEDIEMFIDGIEFTLELIRKRKDRKK